VSNRSVSFLRSATAFSQLIPNHHRTAAAAAETATTTMPFAICQAARDGISHLILSIFQSFTFLSIGSINPNRNSNRQRIKFHSLPSLLLLLVVVMNFNCSILCCCWCLLIFLLLLALPVVMVVVEFIFNFMMLLLLWKEVDYNLLSLINSPFSLSSSKSLSLSPPHSLTLPSRSTQQNQFISSGHGRESTTNRDEIIK